MKALNAGLDETLIAVVRNSEGKDEIRGFDLLNPDPDAPSRLLLSSEQVGSDQILGLDIDQDNRRIFYSVRSTDPVEYRLKVSPLEGGTVRVVATETEIIIDVAYDPAADRVFYTLGDDIKEVDAEAKDNPKVWNGYSGNITTPSSLAIDSGGNNLVWGEYGLDNANIYMLPLSSTGAPPITVVEIPLVTFGEEVNYLSVDPITSLLYVSHIDPSRCSIHSLAAPGGPVTPFWIPDDSPGEDWNYPNGIFTRNDLGRVFFVVDVISNATGPAESHLMSANLAGESILDLGVHTLLRAAGDIFIVKKDVVDTNEGLNWQTVALVAGVVLGLGALVGVVVCITSTAGADYRSQGYDSQYSVSTKGNRHDVDVRAGRTRSNSRGRRPSGGSGHSGHHNRRRDSRGSNASGTSGRSGGKKRKKSRAKRGTLTPAPTYGLEDTEAQAKRMAELSKKGY